MNIEDYMKPYYLVLYEELRNDCTTYSDLKKAIKKYSQGVSFRNRELGAYAKKELFEMYDKEIGEIHIRKDG